MPAITAGIYDCSLPLTLEPFIGFQSQQLPSAAKSKFLPYTIDFKATELKHARRQSSASEAVVDGQIIGRLAESRRRRYSKEFGASVTPGATTDDEKIFKPYVSQAAGEIPSADDPSGPGINEPRSVFWGRSRKFNQPRPTTAPYPEKSIVSNLDLGVKKDVGCLYDGAVDGLQGLDGCHGSPRAVLSDADWVVKAAEQGNGGLHNAVHAAEKTGVLRDKMWVGTLGMPTDTLKNETRASISETLEDEFESLAVFVKDSEFVGHYSHFCRAVLWPALHYQMQESPRHTEYDNYSWKQYVKVNEAFAKTIAAHWRPGDSVWVHDYHLLLVPSILRAKFPDIEIGFFMHASFPSSEVFRCLNARRELLDGLLGADLLGFQTEEYCHHFLQACSRLLNLEITDNGIQLPDRFVTVKEFPCGTDVDALNELRQTNEVKDWINNIHERYSGKHLIVGRDKLDGPGGIKQKLLAYELFLKRYPKWRENVVLIQIASASEMPDLEAQVSRIAMRINSEYSSLTHQPFVFLRHDISYSQFLALMSVAEIFIVSSLREGMNLTCHDYINCQDGKLTPQRHGSLILSEFTGSASIFQGHKLLVNPWDYQEVADTINNALELSAEQKQQNWQFLRDRMAPHTAMSWVSTFQSSLFKSSRAQSSHKPTPISALAVKAIKESYERSSKRLIFLEDESIFSTKPQQKADPEPTSEPYSLLESLASNPKNQIYITSNKSPEQLGPITAKLPGHIGYIAENGCFKREINMTKWETLVDTTPIADWRAGIRKVMTYFHERTPGSRIDDRRCLLTFDYHDAHDRYTAARQASELADQISGPGGGRSSDTIRVVCTSETVTAEPLSVTKATAAESIQTLSEGVIPDFIFVAGGSRADESLFHFANELAGSKPKDTAVTLKTNTCVPTEAMAVAASGAVLDVLGVLV